MIAGKGEGVAVQAGGKVIAATGPALDEGRMRQERALRASVAEVRNRDQLARELWNVMRAPL